MKLDLSSDFGGFFVKGDGSDEESECLDWDEDRFCKFIVTLYRLDIVIDRPSYRKRNGKVTFEIGTKRYANDEELFIARFKKS